jgi:hypothetical protein
MPNDSDTAADRPRRPAASPGEAGGTPATDQTMNGERVLDPDTEDAQPQHGAAESVERMERHNRTPTGDSSKSGDTDRSGDTNRSGDTGKAGGSDRSPDGDAA